MRLILARLAVLSVLSCGIWLTTSAQCFSDADLASLVDKKTSALLYVWSPRMVLSGTEARDVATLATAEALSFVPLHDPRVGAAELNDALKRLPHTALNNSQSLCSPALIQREATRHFPTSFVMANGQLDPLPLVGAMPVTRYQQAVRDRLSARPSTEPPVSQCIPQNEFITLPPTLAGTQTDSYGKTTVALGSYERVSPDGRFILRSYSGARMGDVSLVELSHSAPNKPASVIRVIPTALSNEAFPVQGTWRYLVSTSGEHFALADIVANGSHAKALLKGGMTGFYAAASELPALPASAPHHIRIRSFSWPNASGDSQTQGEGALTVRTITVNTQTHHIITDTGHQNICGHRLKEDGALYALPMISVDGAEFAALPQNPDKLTIDGKQTMRIYGFGANGHGCEAKTSFDFASGKTIFGFPENTQTSGSANLAYEYKGQTWWFNRALNLPFNIAPFEDSHASIRRVDASAFPGITKDGRVIYGATWERCEGAPSKACTPEGGYVVSDPYQSNAYRQHLIQAKMTPPKACITYTETALERSNFAQFHGLK